MRKSQKKEIVYSIGEVVRKTFSLVEHSLKNNNIHFEIIEEKDIRIQGLPNEFGQVLLNIIQNAKDALIEKKIQKAQIITRIFEEGLYAVITVLDNAGGIPEDIIHRIFDAYFTTKKDGTGIGLYMSKTIIENNRHGNLTVQNKDSGAIFTIKMKLTKIP